ncbi:MAG: RnfABCDGE type electron transport complex subunit C [Candidatus Omnitrophota bacterium]|jgi:electron transport complex protein RnfC
MKGRIRLGHKKDALLRDWTIRRMRPPAKVRIPAAHPCVSEGARVVVGQKIAEPAGAADVPVYAGVSGQVTQIGRFEHPEGGCRMIEITAEKTERTLPEIGCERKGWQDLSPGALRTLFRACGLVEMSPGTGALHSRIERAEREEAGLLILNACESEPYVASGHALIMSHPLEILKGAELLRKASGAEQVVITTEQDKMEAAELLKSKIYFLKWNHYAVKVLPQAYPQDIDTMLSGKTKATVHLPATAYAVYEAVVLQKPLYERVVTVGGECVYEPKNTWVRIGTSLADLFGSCKGLLREPGRVLLGGPMRGVAAPSREVPVLAGSDALLAIPSEVVRKENAVPCIRCGRCTEACPAEISPAMITQAVENFQRATACDYGAGRCLACGNCTYVCPSRRPMSELMTKALAWASLRTKDFRKRDFLT